MCRLCLSPHCPLLKSRGGPGTEAYLQGGVEERQKMRVAGGQLFSSPKMSQGSGHRFKSDVHLSLPPFLSTILPLGFSGGFALLPCRYTVHLSFFIFPPSVDPLYPCPATFFVQPISLNWYQHRGDGCCVSQLGEMR